MLDWLADNPTAHRRLMVSLALFGGMIGADALGGPLWSALVFALPLLALEIHWTLKDARARPKRPPDPPQ